VAPAPPWRSYEETRLIRRLVWQWFTFRGPGKWSARAVGRRFGVSHTYIQKLVCEFVTDPSKIEQEVRSSYPATFEQLSRAQEETRRQKDSGWLHPLRRWKWAEYKIGGQVVRERVPTKAEQRRKAAEAAARVPRVPQEVPIWATGIPYYSLDR